MVSKFFLILFIFFTCTVLIWTRKKLMKRMQKSCKLAPGSLGWPYIGETLQLYSQHPNAFFSTRQKRYGEVFKTHILGCPCIMLASPDAARFVLVNRAGLFKPTYPKTKETLIGPAALFFHQGSYHRRLRKLVQAAMSPDALRRLVPAVEELAVSAFASWADGRVINTYRHMKMLSFEVGIIAILGHLKPHYKEELKKNYAVVERGYNSFATNLLGTRYYKAIKARKRLSEILNCVAKERRENPLTASTAEKDLLSILLNSRDEDGGSLSQDQITDNIIGVLFAAQDTMASAMTWIIKYLHDNPKLLEAVKAEQKTIFQSNGDGMSKLTWKQTRNMQFTHKVILESLRMSSITSFTFREAVADVEYKGYLIPKGWKVMPLFRNIHHNPDFFAEPHKFDPSRFEMKFLNLFTPNTGHLQKDDNKYPKYLTKHIGALKPNTFMPFGSGVHACPGNELAKLEILIMVHHLASHCRYELVGSDNGGIQYGPFPVPLHGLPSRFWKDESTKP